MYKAPSVDTISKSIRSAIQSELPDTDPFIWPNNLYVTSKVVAQALRGLYLRLEWVHRQAFASRADGDLLEVLHGAEIGITRLPAVVATGEAILTFTAAATVPAGTRFLRSNSVAYRLVNAVSATAADVAADVSQGRMKKVASFRADEAEARGNAVTGSTLRLETPITGVGTAEVDSGGITGGADLENDTSLRMRILDRKRNPPHGGSPAEYVTWAREVPGVTRVYVYRATPVPGAVTVLFMMDESYGNGIPQDDDVDRLQAHLDTVAPANAKIVVAVPTEVTVHISISNLAPNNQKVRDEIWKEINAMFRRRSIPGSATGYFRFSKSWISEAISMATGESSHTVTLLPTDGDIVCGEYEMATMGGVTYA